MKKVFLLSLLVTLSLNYAFASQNWWEDIDVRVDVNGSTHHISTTNKNGAVYIVVDDVLYPEDHGSNVILTSDFVDSNGIKTNLFIARLNSPDSSVNWKWANNFVKATDKSNCTEKSEFAFAISQRPKDQSAWMIGNCF